MEDEIRIWIGTEEKTNIPCKVLEHSILKNTKFPERVKFFKDPGISWKTPAGRKLGVGTGFSLQRWYIPEKMNFEGFCIYLDADMLVFGDITDLWNYKSELIKQEKTIACTYQSDKWFKHAPATSVMLIDCDGAGKWKYHTQVAIENYLSYDKDRSRYIALMHINENLFKENPLEIDINWNRFNKFVNGTKLLHYTVEPDQPWYKPSHPFKNLWRDALIKALKDGYITRQEIEKELKRYVQPSSCCRGEGLHSYWSKFAIHAIK
jgi:hypothetical protein